MEPFLTQAAVFASKMSARYDLARRTQLVATVDFRRGADSEIRGDSARASRIRIVGRYRRRKEMEDRGDDQICRSLEFLTPCTSGLTEIVGIQEIVVMRGELAFERLVAIVGQKDFGQARIGSRLTIFISIALQAGFRTHTVVRNRETQTVAGCSSDPSLSARAPIHGYRCATMQREFVGSSGRFAQIGYGAVEVEFYATAERISVAQQGPAVLIVGTRLTQQPARTGCSRARPAVPRFGLR